MANIIAYLKCHGQVLFKNVYFFSFWTWDLAEGGGQIEPPSPEYPGFQLRSRDSVKMTLKLSFKISNFQWLVQEAKF